MVGGGEPNKCKAVNWRTSCDFPGGDIEDSREVEGGGRASWTAGRT